MKRFLMVAPLIALLLGASFFPGIPKTYRDIDVSTGGSAREVARALVGQGALWTPYPFLFWVKIRSAGRQLKAGRYRVREGRSAFWLVDDLMGGHSLKARVLIPEGFSSWQIADRLQRLGVCSGVDFRRYVAEQKLEGYLYPATYEFALGIPAEKAALRMKDEFEARWTDEMEQRASGTQRSRQDVVILASIIEREAERRSELPQIAAVYLNRLKKNMRLEADPTVQFALGRWKARLTYADYRNTISPYNTYRVFGLPPGPICNPAVDAMRAVLWPADSDALFLLARADGYHTFSNTYREHVNKVNARNRNR